MALVEDTGFDAFAAGPLAQSWRQQPGTRLLHGSHPSAAAERTGGGPQRRSGPCRRSSCRPTCRRGYGRSPGSSWRRGETRGPSRSTTSAAPLLTVQADKVFPVWLHAGPEALLDHGEPERLPNGRGTATQRPFRRSPQKARSDAPDHAATMRQRFSTARRAANTARKTAAKATFPQVRTFPQDGTGGAGGTRTQKRDASHLRKRHRGGHSHPAGSRCIRLDPCQRHCGAVRTARLQGTARARMRVDPPGESAASQPIARLIRSACCRLRHRLAPSSTQSHSVSTGHEEPGAYQFGFPATQVAEGLRRAAGSGPLPAGEPTAAIALRQNRAAAAWRVSGRIRVMSPQAVRLRRRFCQG